MTKNIEKELFLKAAPERVFQALTEKAELERWFVKQIEIDLRPGGAVSFDWDRAGGVFEVGKILVLEAPHRFSYTWEALSPAPTPVIFELTAENDGTRLHLTHTGIGEGEDWENYYAALNNGWNVHLSHLTDWLESGVSITPEPAGTLHHSSAMR